jgi:hypothetical protein
VPAAKGGIRVIVKSPLPVTYLEVFLDGRLVLQKGEVLEAEAQPGWTLERPLVLDVKRGQTVLESELPVGPHAVTASLAMTRVVPTEWDAARRAHGQRYETTRIDGLGASPVCEVREGTTCVVFVRAVKRGEGHVVAYDVTMREAPHAEGQIASSGP